MKVFSGLQLEKGVDYSFIQNYVWASHFVSVSLLDNCKRMTSVHPHFQKNPENWPTMGLINVTLKCMLQVVYQL